MAFTLETVSLQGDYSLVIAFKIAPPCRGIDSYNFMHSKQYEFCKISDWTCAVK